MPPLEWSLVQSTLLWLILPTFGTAFGLMILSMWITWSPEIRSEAAPVAFLIGLTVGLIVQNYRAELVPFLPLQQVEQPTELNDDATAQKKETRWEFETGWRSIYLATIFAGLAEIRIESLFRKRPRSWIANIAMCLVVFLCAFLLCPWDLRSKQPWIIGLLAIVILLNQWSLRGVSQSKFGFSVPLFLATIWGGSTIALAVLSHSALFADLAMLMGSSLAGVGLATILMRVQPNAIVAGPACFIPALILADQQNTFSEIPLASFLLIATAPVWLAILFIAKARIWFESRPITIALWFSIPCAIAVGLAMRAEL